MFVIIWRYRIRAAHLAAFEQHDADGGRWAKLFRPGPARRRTRLLRDADDANAYLAIDESDSLEAYEQFRRHHAAAYAELDPWREGLTSEEPLIGHFEYSV